jgi:hypothetical protein
MYPGPSKCPERAEEELNDSWREQVHIAYIDVPNANPSRITKQAVPSLHPPLQNPGAVCWLAGQLTEKSF